MTQPYETSAIDTGTVNDLLKRVAELEDQMQAHTGDAQGSAGQFYPHPIQSIDTAEYGGGAERLDSTGIQLKVGTSFTTAIFWLPDFSSTPTSVSAYNSISSYISPGSSGSLQIHANNATSTAVVTLTSSTSSNSASVVVGPVIGFSGITANPTSLLTGSVFYRSDENCPYSVDNSAQIRNLHALDMNEIYITNTDSPYTIGQKVGALKCNATGGAITVNLPDIVASSTGSGRTITIWKSDASANAVTVTPNGADRIEGAATYSLATRYKSVTLIDSGDDGGGVATWKVLCAT